MTNDGEASTHRRRRRRNLPRQGPLPGPNAAPGGSTPEAERPHRKQAARDSGERGLRDIVGAGRSQLGVSGALRGRDVDRPTDEDLAEAEETLQIVRRHWTPPA
ncbi:MAG TPA: hypothetical protein VGH43_10050 [Jatrophihabitans sp.]|jgi:hypothetical protein